jgi:hypothetical protein
MKRRTLALVPLLALAFATDALGKLEPADWQKVEKQFKEMFPEAGMPVEKSEVVRQLGKDGEPRAFKMLTEAMVLEAGHVATIAKAHAEALEKLQPMLARNYREMSQGDYDAMVAAQADARTLDRAKTDEAKLLDLIVETVAAGPEELRKGVLARSKGHAEWTVRAAAARLAAATAEDAASKAILQEALEKEKDPRVRLGVLETLERTAKGTSWHPLVIGRLTDADWTVQVVAARVVRAREVGKAIPALIEALAKADARVAEELVASLRTLTGQNFDPAAEVWAKWWEDNRGKFGEDGRPLDPVKAGPSKHDIEFYGLKVKSDRVVFVVDMSGSMKLEMDPPKPTAPGAPPPTTGGEEKKPEGDDRTGKIKIDVARRELKRALDALPKSATFNVIAFNHNVVQWQPHMQPASADAKAKAYEWFTAMEPMGSTFLDGALQMAFKMAGVGAFDKAYAGVAIDTIIVLTDGAPTDNAYPDSANMDNETILQHVREWNATHLVKVHCVGIDRVHGIELLKKLAAENGGTYVDG